MKSKSSKEISDDSFSLVPKNPFQPDSYHNEYQDDPGHVNLSVGDVIGNKYIVRYEGGIGSFGRVYVCMSIDTLQSYAVKVIRSIERYVSAGEVEAEILEDMWRFDPKNTSGIVRMIESFHWGKSYCIVFERLGPSLLDVSRLNDYVPYPYVLTVSVTKQIASALESIHKRRLIHTDLKLENVLFKSSNPLSTFSIPNNMFHLESSRAPRSWQLPDTFEVKVIDMGGATYDYKSKSSLINTRQYRSPEVLLGLGWSMASDMWCLGCIAMEMYTGKLLFHSHSNREHLAMIQRILGPFPEEIYSQRTNLLVNKYFTPKGAVRFPTRSTDSESAGHVESLYSLEAQVSCRHEHFLDLISGLLRFNPQERMKASEVASHPAITTHPMFTHSSQTCVQKSKEPPSPKFNDASGRIEEQVELVSEQERYRLFWDTIGSRVKDVDSLDIALILEVASSVLSSNLKSIPLSVCAPSATGDPVLRSLHDFVQYLNGVSSESNSAAVSTSSREPQAELSPSTSTSLAPSSSPEKSSSSSSCSCSACVMFLELQRRKNSRSHSSGDCNESPRQIPLENVFSRFFGSSATPAATCLPGTLPHRYPSDSSSRSRSGSPKKRQKPLPFHDPNRVVPVINSTTDDNLYPDEWYDERLERFKQERKKELQVLRERVLQFKQEERWLASYSSQSRNTPSGTFPAEAQTPAQVQSHVSASHHPISSSSSISSLSGGSTAGVGLKRKLSVQAVNSLGQSAFMQNAQTPPRLATAAAAAAATATAAAAAAAAIKGSALVSGVKNNQDHIFFIPSAGDSMNSVGIPPGTLPRTLSDPGRHDFQTPQREAYLEQSHPLNHTPADAAPRQHSSLALLSPPQAHSHNSSQSLGGASFRPAQVGRNTLSNTNLASSPAVSTASMGPMSPSLASETFSPSNTNQHSLASFTRQALTDNDTSKNPPAPGLPLVASVVDSSSSNSGNMDEAKRARVANDLPASPRHSTTLLAEVVPIEKDVFVDDLSDGLDDIRVVTNMGALTGPMKVSKRPLRGRNVSSRKK